MPLVHFLVIPTGSNFHGSRHHAKFVCFARHFYQLTSDTYPNGRRHPRGNAYSTHLVTPPVSVPLLVTTVRSVPHPTQLGACAGAELHLHNFDSNFNFNFQLSFCFNFSRSAWEFFLLVFIVFICAGGCWQSLTILSTCNLLLSRATAVSLALTGTPLGGDNTSSNTFLCREFPHRFMVWIWHSA